MPLHSEMMIPKGRSEVVMRCTFTAIVVSFALLAIVNLYSGVALIASLLWLAFVAAVIWSGCRQEGGLRQYFICLIGDFFGRRFVEWNPAESQPREIRFGFKLLGHRFIQKCMALDSIQTVEWNTGQATALAGRDMDDWQVWIWFDHDDPKKTETQRKWQHPKPDQDLYGVGPSARKEKTEALGLSFVAFLRNAGADLVQGNTSSRFVRQTVGGH